MKTCWARHTRPEWPTHHARMSVSPVDERLVVGSPVGDLELLFFHVISLQDQECGDLILTAAKSSIYSTKPYLA